MWGLQVSFDVSMEQQKYAEMYPSFSVRAKLDLVLCMPPRLFRQPMIDRSCTRNGDGGGAATGAKEQVLLKRYQTKQREKQMGMVS